jgi:hypothetical protein
LVILSEENHENIRALEGDLVQWHMKKLILVIFLRKIKRISGPKREAMFTGV